MKKSFKFINSDEAFKELLQELDTKPIQPFFIKSDYEKRLDKLITIIKAIGEMDLMQSIFKDCLLDKSYYDYNVHKEDLIIKDFLKYIYDSDFDLLHTGIIRNKNCIYSFDYAVSECITDKFSNCFDFKEFKQHIDTVLSKIEFKNIEYPSEIDAESDSFKKYIYKCDLIEYIAKHMNSNMWFQETLNIFKNGYYCTFEYKPEISGVNVNDTDSDDSKKNKHNSKKAKNEFQFNLIQVIDFDIDFYNKIVESFNEIHGESVYEMMAFLKRDFGDERIVNIIAFIQLYLQNLVHINFIKNNDINYSIDTLCGLPYSSIGKFPSSDESDELGYNISNYMAVPSLKTISHHIRFFYEQHCKNSGINQNDSKKIDFIDEFSKLESYMFDLSVIDFDFNFYTYNSSSNHYLALDKIELAKRFDLTKTMSVNGIDLSSFAKCKLDITKSLLTRLFMFYISNSGGLKCAFIHQNNDYTINDNILYIYDYEKHCYRYFDIEGNLESLLAKILSVVHFSYINSPKEKDFLYNGVIAIKQFLTQNVRDRNLTYRLRDKLNYTAFVVDNGTVIFNKLTGEFIFCDNLYSARLMTFVKFKGTFDKEFFENHFNMFDNPLMMYTSTKIKYGRTQEGLLNEDVYGLVVACVLNLFQHDVDTHTACVFLGQHGTGKTLLINALKNLDSEQGNSNFSKNVSLLEYTNQFVKRDVERYHRTWNNEFSVKEYNDNAIIKNVLERGSVWVNEKYKDGVTVDINSKSMYTGEEFMRINVDGGLKERFVLFEMRDKSKDTFFTIDGLHNIEMFLDYNITHTFCGLYDGFIFQLKNNVFNSDGRIYSRLFMKYNPNTYNSFIERVSNIGGIDIVLSINNTGILNQTDLKNVLKICESCNYDADIKKIARGTLSRYLNKYRDYNSNNRIFNGIDFKNTKESTLINNNTTFKRQPYSIGIEFNREFLNDLKARLENDDFKYKNDLDELNEIIKRSNGYTKDDLRYIVKKYGHQASLDDINLDDYTDDTTEKNDIITDALTDMKNTFSDKFV